MLVLRTNQDALVFPGANQGDPLYKFRLGRPERPERTNIRLVIRHPAGSA